jgi:hypothetical protein
VLSYLKVLVEGYRNCRCSAVVTFFVPVKASLLDVVFATLWTAGRCLLFGPCVAKTVDGVSWVFPLGKF